MSQPAVRDGMFSSYLNGCDNLFDMDCISGIS
jgi:hypothetical protein